jgi:GR25 family glycosyltransferase involved in LPS biosynthesis
MEYRNPAVTIFCISCPKELPEEHAAAVAHFKERGVDAEFVNGIHAETFGVLAWRPYTKDDPKGGYLIRMAQVGLALSHYMVWQICLRHGDETFLILEADSEFPENWKPRMESALLDCPEDWQILLLGSCNCSDKPQSQIKGEVFEVKYPFTTHAYIVKLSAIPILLDSCRDASAHIDITMIDRAYPKLRTFTVLPRIVGQRGRVLAD